MFSVQFVNLIYCYIYTLFGIRYLLFRRMRIALAIVACLLLFHTLSLNYSDLKAFLIQTQTTDGEIGIRQFTWKPIYVAWFDTNRMPQDQKVTLS